MRHQAALNAVGVIPARYDSTRFPGKPLALIAGRPLVQRVHERARGARLLSRLLVATDDERIAAVVRGFGGEVVLTSPDHPSGTDRLAEVARRLPADLYVNIQGDEPMLDPRDLDRLVERLGGDPAADAATLAEPLDDAGSAADPNVVKVVCDAAGRALYFSRSPVPHAREAARPGAPGPWRRHVGLYAYRAAFLREFASWPVADLERLEGLEQLRILERGRTIVVIPALGRYHGVDTPADVAAVEKALSHAG
jgi:3-deoxy-manno-octulosonate cytidylyltransferase (CMP-KDO synthetase)